MVHCTTGNTEMLFSKSDSDDQDNYDKLHDELPQSPASLASRMKSIPHFDPSLPFFPWDLKRVTRQYKGRKSLQIPSAYPSEVPPGSGYEIIHVHVLFSMLHNIMNFLDHVQKDLLN